MKRIHHIFWAVLVLATSCQQDFLQRTPKSAVTGEDFFNTVTDLETYTNGLYGQLRANFTDLLSDNIALSNNDRNAEVRTLLAGTLSPATVGGWNRNSWGNLRRINFMLDNVGKTTGDRALIDHYIGIARFFRANFYYNMVKRYGDVPWYGKVIGSADEDLLYKAKDPRTAVVDSIMKDLEFAAANVLPGWANNTTVTKWAALTLLARTALHEGTYRKYHAELNLQATADAYLQRAASASREIMDDGGFAIEGADATDFRALFSSNNLSGNKEVIFLQKNDRQLGVTNNTHTVHDWQWALSAGLADEFLTDDGTPFTAQAGYDKKTFVEMFEHRDPRLAETIMPPGFGRIPGGDPYITRPDFGGMLQLKFYPRDPALRGGWELNYTDLPIFRLAEVLLINAEAKAELGTLTQADLDATVNSLRTRVGMPSLDMAAANSAPDAYLSAKYPAVSGANRGVLLEIRRERRVELACEGFRFDDLYRWKAGALLAEDPAGIYVPALGALDVTGDGQPDIAMLQNGDESPLSGLPANVRDALTKYNISTGSFYLQHGTSGRVMFNDDRTDRPRSFDESKHYHFPIPLEQTVLNPNLRQPTGW